MRTVFLRDLSKLHNLLFSDPEYYNKSGYLAISEIEGGEHAALSLIYSVYLVLDFDGAVTIERFKKYVNDMHLYQHYAFSSQYHLIKAAELRFKEGYPYPFNFAYGIQKYPEEKLFDIFLPMYALIMNDKKLQQVFYLFEAETK